MTHAFYNLTPQQRQFQLKLAAGYLLSNVIVGALLFFVGLPFLILFVFAFSLSVIAPFVDVPSSIKAGTLHYYSPMLIGEKVRNQRLVLHGGSLFDYYFVLDRTQSASQRRKAVYVAYIEGLLNLIDRYENQQPTQITIKATSHILNSRTAKKIGLKPVSADALQQGILYFNFINLTCTASLLNGKLTWPKLKQTSTYQGELDTLIAKKAGLQRLRQRLG